MPDFRRNMFEDLEDMQRQMDRFMDHLVGSKRPVYFYAPSAWQPAIDIYETAEALVLVLDAAGIDKDSLDISIDRNILSIRGERQDSRSGHPQKYHMAEISFGCFERQFELPVSVDADQASATYQDGMLQIVFPKTNEQTPKSVRIRNA